MLRGVMDLSFELRSRANRRRGILVDALEIEQSLHHTGGAKTDWFPLEVRRTPTHSARLLLEFCVKTLNEKTLRHDTFCVDWIQGSLSHQIGRNGEFGGTLKSLKRSQVTDASENALP